jgi:hypothetical protein
MIVYSPTLQFFPETIQFLETKPNIIMNGVFTKIIYSDEHMTLTGLYAYVSFHIYMVKNNICYFDTSRPENADSIKQLVTLEKKILQYYKDIYFKGDETIFVCSLERELQRGTIKIHANSLENLSTHGNTILKISGIWENNNTIGLTFKFFQLMPHEPTTPTTTLV